MYFGQVTHGICQNVVPCATQTAPLVGRWGLSRGASRDLTSKANESEYETGTNEDAEIVVEESEGREND